MSFLPPNPGGNNAIHAIPTRIMQLHARDLRAEGAELFNGVWVRPELNESDATELGFNRMEFHQYHTRRNAEFDDSEASTALGMRPSCAPFGNWSAWKQRAMGLSATPRASPSATGFPVAGSSASMGVSTGTAVQASRGSTSDEPNESKPKYTAAELREYMRYIVEGSENPENFFKDLQIDAVMAERRFIRQVHEGVITGDLDTLVAKFEAIRLNQSSENEPRKRPALSQA